MRRPDFEKKIKKTFLYLDALWPLVEVHLQVETSFVKKVEKKLSSRSPIDQWLTYVIYVHYNRLQMRNHIKLSG